MRKIIYTVMFAAYATTSAYANDELSKILSPFDKLRLENFSHTKAAALAEGLRGGTPDQVNTLTQALAGAPQLVSQDFNPIGEWKCRIIKVGGILAITPYNWFKCRITEDELGLFVEKLSGSQRFTGRLYNKSDTEHVFIGAGHLNNDPPRSYGDNPTHDQVAIVTMRTKTKLVFEFPAPKFESKLDVLVMER